MSSTAEHTWGFEVSPREWPGIVRDLRDDPGDVAVGVRLFFSVGGHDEEPTYRRLIDSETGRALVRDATSYPPLFSDFEGLRSLPDGTLGREYVREIDERGIHPVELARLSQPAYTDRDFTHEHAYVRDRVRDAHDLYHTLTGHGIDVIGEAGVLSFTFGQTGNKGWLMLVLLNHLTALLTLRFNGWLVAWRGYWNGRRARYLPAVDEWDRLLRLPVEAVRAELGISAPQPYRPLDLDAAFEWIAKGSH
jgi:ubiquinone biosynthesis protein COQ4